MGFQLECYELAGVISDKSKLLTELERHIIILLIRLPNAPNYKFVTSVQAETDKTKLRIKTNSSVTEN